jgi:hypothetical protein
LACSTRGGSTAAVVGTFVAAAAFAVYSAQLLVTTAFVDAAIAKTVVIARWAAATIAV